MPLYTIRYLDGNTTEIVASTETWARHEAMMQKWGPPKPLNYPEPGTRNCFVIGEPLYLGSGLDVIAAHLRC